MSNDNNISINDFQTEDIPIKEEYVGSYDFLDPEKVSENNEEELMNSFETAFQNSHPIIQDYILSDKLGENIKKICKLEKLDEELCKTILENISVSVLVGQINPQNIKENIIEGFRNLNMQIEDFTINMIVKDIDTYILSDVKKLILEEERKKEESQIKKVEVVAEKVDSRKEELRKMLLESTGNTTKKIENNYKKPINEEKVTRESLLENISIDKPLNLQNVEERMQEIAKEEKERLASINKTNTETPIKSTNQINEEVVETPIKSTYTSETNSKDETFDPYREDLI